MTDENTIPVNELDLQFQLTNPVWGNNNVSPELTERLKELKLNEAYKDDKGQIVVPVTKLWGLLSYYTRDMRLANLSVITGEFDYCRKYLDLAGDCLREGYIKAFLCALSRTITILELSQSKNGFFRKRSNTVTNENYISPLEPQKKSLFGAGNKNNNDYGGRYV